MTAIEQQAVSALIDERDRLADDKHDLHRVALSAQEREAEGLRKIVALQDDRDRLRAFCRDVFEVSDWPECFDVGGAELQEIAIKHGLLLPDGERDGVPNHKKADWLAEKVQP